MSTRFVAVKRGGKHAIVRVMPSGDAAGYDAVADRQRQQVHYAIYRDRAHATAVDMAFSDSRQYPTLEAAMADAERSGRAVEIA